MNTFGFTSGQRNARVRCFGLANERGGIPEDVGVLVTEMTDTSVTVISVNLSAIEPRTLMVQGGAYGEHRLMRGLNWGARIRYEFCR